MAKSMKEMERSAGLCLVHRNNTNSDCDTLYA
jgi:hypothetical protein